ncbi:RuBisCO large subunit C-terminal-like domain-containing protein [Candidatus Chlorohelix sp.]|uniref:RuBisCO large subunit C-terminal-like domain-containing protein n=1 Tax=Candidatus Chlorohelix sp. TaxID=3139201 RepID=UPI00306E6E3D
MNEALKRKESDERFSVTYQITVYDNRSIEEHARDITVEQSVEIPHDCIPDEIHERGIVGWIESIEPILNTQNQYDVVISYRSDNTAFSIPQFLNVIYGNISLKKGIKIIKLDLTPALLDVFGGPAYGIEGIRNLTGTYKRPLACTALKPLGLSTTQLAKMAGEYASGGLDIIKEDHGMADMAYHRFVERVPRFQEAVTEANAKTGGNTLFFPMISGGFDEIEQQVALAKSLDIKGILVAPLLVGVDTVRALARKYKLAIMTHPSFTGTHFHDPAHGMTPAVLLGTIFRLIGADISIFINSGGRFAVTEEECQDLATALRGTLGHIKPSFPCPGGGMRLDRIEAMAQSFGQDTVMLIGGALMQHSRDLEKSASLFMEGIRQHFGEERRAVAH